MNKSTSLDFLGIKNNSKVLLVYPHPDDETYCNAGLIQKLVLKCINPSVLCLTKGGASTLAYSLKQAGELTVVRKNEFERVMRFLGVINYKIFDLVDGELTADKEQVYELIKEQIYALKPDYVVTYEPSGIYGHPDHIIVSEIVTEIAKTIPYKVIYSTVDKSYKSSESSLKMAKQSHEIKPVEPNFQIKLTFVEYIRKIKALRLYRSQVSLKQEFSHKVYQAVKMLNEYYFVLK
jgi:LmbE family N-acetylglucosaminyl deacetylase